MIFVFIFWIVLIGKEFLKIGKNMLRLAIVKITSVLPFRTKKKGVSAFSTNTLESDSLGLGIWG